MGGTHSRRCRHLHLPSISLLEGLSKLVNWVLVPEKAGCFRDSMGIRVKPTYGWTVSKGKSPLEHPSSFTIVIRRDSTRRSVAAACTACRPGGLPRSSPAVCHSSTAFEFLMPCPRFMVVRDTQKWPQPAKGGPTLSLLGSETKSLCRSIAFPTPLSSSLLFAVQGATRNFERR